MLIGMDENVVVDVVPVLRTRCTRVQLLRDSVRGSKPILGDRASMEREEQ